MAKPNIGDLIPVGAIGTAKAPQVLTGYTFSGDAGVGLAGSMPSRGNASGTITTQGGSIAINEGYYSGGNISANFANLVAGNIRSGVTVGGVRGSYSPSAQITVKRFEKGGSAVYGSKILSVVVLRNTSYGDTMSYTTTSTELVGTTIAINGNKVTLTGWHEQTIYINVYITYLS